MITILGAPGAGKVILSISGSIDIAGPGSFQPTTYAQFDNGSGNDTDLEFPDFIADAGIQDTVVTDLQDNTLQATYQGTSAGIDGFFLDDDGDINGDDDFGIRMDSMFTWDAGGTMSFSGSAILPYDITAFEIGAIRTNVFNATGLTNEGQVTLTVQAVPVPPALPALALGLGALATIQRRRS